MKKRVWLVAILVVISALLFGMMVAFASIEDMRTAYAAQKYQQAIQAADAVLAQDESYMDAYYVKAMSQYRLGDKRGAYETLTQQLAHNPCNEVALYNAACAASIEGMKDEAVALLERALALDITQKSQIQADGDFANIRNHPGYQKLMEVSVVYGGELLTFDVPPVIKDGRTLLPLRKIFEVFDAEVSFDGATKTVRAQKDDFLLELTLDSKTAFVNGKETELDVPPMLQNDRTLVPVRFVSEALQAEVSWDGDNQVVSILTAAPNGTAPYAATVEQMDAMLAVLPVDGIFIEPYLLPQTEGITMLVFKDIAGLRLFDSLSEADKSKYVSETVYDNYGLVVGCDPVHAKVVYDGRVYYEGDFCYDNQSELPLTYYCKGKPINVVKQYKDSAGGNYKDFYLLPAEQQVTSRWEEE